MSYTPPNTFVNGTTVVAADLQQNIESMQSYANGGVVPADLATSQWVGQQHVVRPKYEAGQRRFVATTGVSAHTTRNQLVSRYTYVQRATSKRNQNANVWQFLPQTAQEISFVKIPKMLFVQFSFGATTPSDSTVATGTGFGFPGTNVRLLFFAGRVSDVSSIQNPELFTEHLLQAEDDSGIGDGVARRDHQSGFRVIANPASSVYTIGLVGRSTMPNTRVWRWSVSIEGWTI